MSRLTKTHRAQPQPTLAQVAAESGVSVSAVSRILAGKKLDTFLPDTVARVKAAAEKFRYRPNRLVRGIQTGRTGLIGVVIPAYNDFYGMVMAGIHDHLAEHDRSPVVLWSAADAVGQQGRTELEQIHSLVDLRVEGIILKPVFDAASDQYMHEIIERNIPLVVVDRALPRVHACFAGSDDDAAMAKLLDFLKSLGHRSIAYCGPATTVSTGVQRLQSFRVFLAQEPSLQGREFLTKEWQMHIGEAEAFLRGAGDVTVVVAVNDWFAHAVCEAAKLLGRRVPQDLSVIGYGNLPFSTYMTPALTTVEQHPYEIGRSAARRLLTRIEKPSESCRKVLIPPDLIVRDSTGPAPHIYAESL
jgi:LacI family transcriptional regulator